MNAETSILGLFTSGLVVLLALPVYLTYWAYQKRKQFKQEIRKQFEMMHLMLDSQKTLEEMVQLCKKQLEEGSESGEKELLKKVKETKKSPFSILFHGKLEECEKQEIRVESEVSIEREELLGTVDMISLFGNILDNAMEACVGLEPSERMIHILIRQEKNLLLLEVTNTKSKSLVLARTGMSTSKSDHLLHGYGFPIIKEIVKRHQGELYVKDRGKEFFLRAFLQL